MESNTTEPICPSLDLPIVSEYPINGYGGSYYNVEFPVPVYNRLALNVRTSVSWADIDDYHNQTTGAAVQYAISLTICAVTLINIIILTPQAKRKLPIMIFTSLALIFHLIYSLLAAIECIESLPASAYFNLTFDMQAIIISRSFYLSTAATQISACLSLTFVQVCFYYQSRALLTWVRLHRRPLYIGIMTYLLLGGAVATVIRAMKAYYNIRFPAITGYSIAFQNISLASFVAYMISLASWSLTVFISTNSIVITRRKTLINRTSKYDTTLNIMSLVVLESFLVPLILCILRLTAKNAAESRAEIFIISSVLFLMPISNLVHATHGGGGNNARVELVRPVVEARPRGDIGVQANSEPSSSSNLRGDSASRYNATVGEDVVVSRKARDPCDAELALIDALDHTHAVECESHRQSD